MDYDAVGTGAEEAATNGKFLALETRLADAIILNVWSSDVGRTVPYNTLALQVREMCVKDRTVVVGVNYLCVVVWTDRGQHIASPSPDQTNRPIQSTHRFRIQAIFQEQLQAEGSPKTLLVVAVHDHDSRGTNDARTREALLGDLEAVWDALPKAEDTAEAELGDLFDVEVRVCGGGACRMVWMIERKYL